MTQSQMMSNVYPVILSGGSGKRLWPLSRSYHPKQFLKLSEEHALTPFQAACKRLVCDYDIQPPTILCHDKHRYLAAEQLGAEGIIPRQIVLEPVSRNTAPAITIAVLSVMSENPEGILVVLPADHIIEDSKEFTNRIREAIDLAHLGKIVLFGVTPDSGHPEHSGFGYIKPGGALDNPFSAAFEVEGFHEKPDKTEASIYLREGGFLWNSGVSVFRGESFLKELERQDPDLASTCMNAYQQSVVSDGFLNLHQKSFAAATDESVDRVLFENSCSLAVVPLDAGWSDIGTWTALSALSNSDENGNISSGTAILEDTQNCYIHSSRNLIATIGVEDLVIVETDDAVLIADSSRTQDIGRLVDRMVHGNRTEHRQHIRCPRHWGYFESIRAGPRYKVKLLHVNPGGKLSLQMHYHRSEHWIVVRGTAKIICEGKEKLIFENESISIPTTSWHQLENPGKVPLEIVEVQIGSYLEEDDIVRREDFQECVSGENR